MDELMDVILKLLAILLGAGLGYVGKLAVNWIKSKLDTQQAAKLDKIIADLVAAAEQMYKANDTSGVIRFDYVTDRLNELGYTVTQEIKDMIESHVLKVNLAIKEANE